MKSQTTSGLKPKSTTSVPDSNADEIEIVESKPSEARGPVKGSHDKTNMFKLLDIVDKRGHNRKVACTFCPWTGWQSHAEEHIVHQHPSKAAEYKELKGKTVQSTLQFDKKKQLSILESAERAKHIGTVQNLEKKIARFLVLRRLPLEVANSSELFDLVRTAINLGTSLPEKDSHKFSIPSRNTLIDRVIEGDAGLLAEYVDDACVELAPLVSDAAPSILFDGAKDANGHSLELFCLQAGSRVFLLWTGLPNDNQKTHEWTHDCLKGLLDGNMDFQLMDVKNDEQEVNAASLASNDISAAASSASSSLPRKKRKTELIPQISRLFEFTPWVCAVGGDNASTPLAAAKLLSQTQGVLYFGCVAHAFSRCYQHICEIGVIKNQLVDKIGAIADLFLTYSQPREILRKFSGQKSVYRIVPTRFITVFLAGQRLLALKDALNDVVADPKFREFYRQNKTGQVKKLADDVSATVQSEDFWKALEFFLKMSIGFVVAVRCFDGALQGSVCLVYQFWSLLSQTVVGVFKEERKLCPSFATRELYDDIKKVIMKNWNKYLYPVFCASYFLCPYYISQIRYYESHYTSWFKSLFDHTLDCCVTVFRRFDLSGTPRPSVLKPDDPSVLAQRDVFENELFDYVRMRGAFTAKSFSGKPRNPTDWWTIEGSKSPLVGIAKKIVSISPSTAPVERLHKLTKSIRTKTRNSIGYARALGLNFICAEEMMRKTSKNVTFAWSQLENYKDRFTGLSKAEEDYLQELAEEEKQAQVRMEDDDELVVSVEDVVDAQLQSESILRTGSTEVEGDLEPEDELESVDETAGLGLSSDKIFPDLEAQ